MHFSKSFCEKTSSFIIGFSLAGYPGLALLSGCIGISPIWFAFPYRSLIALISVWLGLYFWNQTKLSRQQLVFITFLFLLGFRLTTNVIYEFPSSRKELLFFLAAVVLPIFGVIKQQIKGKEKYLENILILLCGYTVIFAFLSEIFGWLGKASLVSSGRLSSIYLNPIILGNTAGLLLLAKLSKNQNSQTLNANVCGWVATCVGILGLSFANSRGPVIAFLGTLLFAFCTIGKNQAKRDFILKGIATAAVLILLLIYNPLRDALISNSIARELPKIKQTQIRSQGAQGMYNLEMANRFNLNHLEIEERPYFLHTSWKAFLDNFWFGVSDWQTFKEGSGHHAHNLFIGIFQNLGIFGGLIFLASLVFSFLQAKDWLRSGHFLVPFLFVQSLLSSQFSGALFGQTQLFISMAILLGNVNYIRSLRL